MTTNVFEGARRIAKLVAVLWILGWVVAAFNTSQIWQDALAFIGGLAFLWAFTWAVGWIVRGFLGIPMGRDEKPTSTQED